MPGYLIAQDRYTQDLNELAGILKTTQKLENVFKKIDSKGDGSHFDQGYRRDSKCCGILTYQGT